MGCSSSSSKANKGSCADSGGTEGWQKYVALSKEDQKLPRVHKAEADILSLMPIPFEARDVMVPLDVKPRCSLCIKRGCCCGYHPEIYEWPVHTVVVGSEHDDKLPIVLVHGFMMGAACFFKLYPMLAAERRVYAIDVIGMGGSGQPPFRADSITPEGAEDLLVEPFVQWAQAMALGEFVLLGHSFGGYVSAAWAARDPGRVKHLGLLSPLLGWTDDRISRAVNREGSSWQRKAFTSIVESAWGHHITPQTLIRWIPGAEGFFKKNAEKRFGRGQQLTEEECAFLAEYTVATMLTPASFEAAATVCFEPFCKPVEMAGGTIKARLAGLKTPMFAIYGDRDWMDQATSEEIPNCRFHILSDSGHHLYFDNPEGLSKMIFVEMAAPSA